MDSYFVPFLEEGEKFKTPPEIKPPFWFMFCKLLTSSIGLLDSLDQIKNIITKMVFLCMYNKCSPYRLDGQVCLKSCVVNHLMDKKKVDNTKTNKKRVNNTNFITNLTVEAVCMYIARNMSYTLQTAYLKVQCKHLQSG